MKKKFIFSVMMFCVSSSFAQIVVDSTGYVGVATEGTPHSALSVASTGRSDSRAYIDAKKRYGLYIYGNDTSLDSITGLYAGVRSGDVAKGIEAYSSSTTAAETYGVHSLSGQGSYACGVFGGINGVSNSTSSAGIYGAYYIPTRATFDYPGHYAGYFRGNTLVTGKIYGTLYSLSSACSSPNSSSSNSIVLGEDNLVLNNLKKIETLQSIRIPVSATCSDDDKGQEMEMSSDELKTLEKENSLPEMQYELDAYQLKKFYPNLVQEDSYGNVSINYVEMVPLLVKAINELSSELAELKGTSAKKVKGKEETTAIEEQTAEVDMVRMDQNKPNPFSESTVITLSIPKDTKTATILIYDLSGKQVKSIPVNERGKTDITVYASDLTAGMYIYSLVVDGQVKVTRRMMVSEK